jgi:hypothetical protein
MIAGILLLHLAIDFNHTKGCEAVNVKQYGSSLLYQNSLGGCEKPCPTPSPGVLRIEYFGSGAGCGYWKSTPIQAEGIVRSMSRFEEGPEEHCTYTGVYPLYKLHCGHQQKGR